MTNYSQLIDWFIEFFPFFSAANPSNRTMPPGFTQPVAGMSSGRFQGRKVRSPCKAEKLTDCNYEISQADQHEFKRSV
jgi:hypothetical protein